MPEVDFNTNVTPLYEAIGKCNWEAASHACRRNPNEAKTWVVRRDAAELSQREGSSHNNKNEMILGKILWRILPLHSACARNPPSTFVSQLITAYPEAVSQKDNSGMYPLHYACGNRASRVVVKQLIESFPRAVREADPLGMLPLHYIAQWGPSDDGIVKMLLDEHIEGVAALNCEGMTPLDLCREASYDGWEKVFSEMEDTSLTRPQVGGGFGSGGVGIGSNGSKIDVSGHKALSAVRNVEEKHTDSLLSATIEVRRNVTPSSFSISHRSRTPPSKLLSSHSLELVNASSSTKCDARDEVSTPRRHHDSDRGATPRSYQSVLAARSRGSIRTNHSNAPHSIICSVASPRYHDMKTPRSSGRGPGFRFGPNTPSSSWSLDFNFEREDQRNNIGCGERIGSNALKSNPPSLTSPMSQKSLQLEGHHESFHPSLTVGNDSLGMRKHCKAGVLSQSIETLQSENAQLHAKLVNYLTIQNENRQLHAQLANYQAVCHENRELHAKLAQLKDIQYELSEMVDLLQRRESIRVSVSANRKKFLLEMLAAEDNLNQEEQCGGLYKGETLPMAIGRQIANIGQLRNGMGHR